jgi:hypothetical protein
MSYVTTTAVSAPNHGGRRRAVTGLSFAAEDPESARVLVLGAGADGEHLVQPG